ncbi:MAG TPA: YciI family protein [Pirellulaceae bacterium]
MTICSFQEFRIMKTWVVISHAGPNRDLSRGARDQSHWDDHATFIDGLVEEGFIRMGGPLVDVGGGLLVVEGTSEESVRDRMDSDPWYRHGILSLERVYEWDIFINQLGAPINNC